MSKLQDLADKYKDCEMCRVYLKNAVVDDARIGELQDIIEDLRLQVDLADVRLEKLWLADDDAMFDSLFEWLKRIHPSGLLKEVE